MKKKVKVSFWGATIESTEQSNAITSLPDYRDYGSENNSIAESVYNIERTNLFRKLDELKNSNNTDIDIDTFKKVRFVYLLLRMYEFKYQPDDEKKLEEILYKNINNSIQFKEVATEFQLSKLNPKPNQTYHDFITENYNEFITKSDAVSEANKKVSEDKAKGKYLGLQYEPIGYEYFTKVFRFYFLEPVMSFFETEKTIQERELAKIRFFSHREQDIENAAIKEAQKSGGVVRRPEHNMEEILPKEPDISSKSSKSFVDRFKEFFNISSAGKKADPDMKKQYDDDIESQLGNTTPKLKDMPFDFINKPNKDLDLQSTVSSNTKATKPSITISKEILNTDIEMGLENTDNNMGVTENQR